MVRILVTFGDVQMFEGWDDEMQQYLEEHSDFPAHFSKWFEHDAKPAIGEQLSIGNLWWSPFRIIEVKHQLDGSDRGIEVVVEPIIERRADTPRMNRHYLEELAKDEWMLGYKPIVL